MLVVPVVATLRATHRVQELAGLFTLQQVAQFAPSHQKIVQLSKFPAQFALTVQNILNLLGSLSRFSMFSRIVCARPLLTLAAATASEADGRCH